jgi:GNAT superfamily N-acetyltransferase
MIYDYQDKLKVLLDAPKTLDAIASLLKIPNTQVLASNYAKDETKLCHPIFWEHTTGKPSNESLYTRLARYNVPPVELGSPYYEYLSYVQHIAGFTAELLPGNYDVILSHSVSIDQDFRNIGLGKLLLELRMQAASEAQASAMVATVNSSNVVERKLLRAAGWKKRKGYTPKYYGSGASAVEFWVKQL